MIAYLDTDVVLWLAACELNRITPKAQDVVRQADLFVAPMVLLELQYLFEIGKIAICSRDILFKVGHDIQLQVCDLAFPLVVEAALDEKWTRDPFDRLIVAQAKANGYSALVTADEKIRKNYPMVIW